MTRIMYDSVSWGAIPANAAIVAGYDTDSIFAWPAAAWARFPNAVKVRIAVTANHNGGHVLDIEIGDATPAQGPGWVRLRRAAGADPTVYCNQSTWPAVRAAFQQQGVAEPHYWIAAYNGNPEIFAGSVAHQFNDPPGSGGNYDVSSVVPFWPGVDGTAPAPAPPHPKRGKHMWIFELPNGSLFVSDLLTFRWLNTGADTSEFLVAADGHGGAIHIDAWQRMGVPADQGSANAAGAPWPAMAS